MNAFFQQLRAATRRNPLMVISVTIIVLLGGSYYFVWQAAVRAQASHDRVQKDGQKMQADLAGHSRITTHLAVVHEALVHIDQNLVVEAELAENLNYFYQMERVSRARLVQMSQLSSQPAPEGVSYKSVPFSIRITGTYFQVMSFVRELETGPRLLRIRNYSFNRADVTTNSLALDLTVELLGHP